MAKRTQQDVPEWLIKFAEHTFTLERAWRTQDPSLPPLPSVATILVGGKGFSYEFEVDLASPFDLAAIRLALESPYGVGERFYQLIENLLAEVDEAIRLLGGNPESKKWSKRDITEILAEAKAYKSIEENLEHLSRQAKQKLKRTLESKLASKARPGQPGLTEEEKLEWAKRFKESGMPQGVFADLNGFSRSTLTRALRLARAVRDAQ